MPFLLLAQGKPSLPEAPDSQVFFTTLFSWLLKPFSQKEEILSSNPAVLITKKGG